jgi:hypothetical protein
LGPFQLDVDEAKKILLLSMNRFSRIYSRKPRRYTVK